MPVHLEFHFPEHDFENVLESDNAHLLLIAGEDNGHALARALHEPEGDFQARALIDKDGGGRKIP